MRSAVSILILAVLSGSVREAAGAVIPVTSVLQKVSGVGGCSLQEAIYSANFDSNVAISRYSASTPLLVATHCVPGSGDDIIILPARALLELSNIVDDAYNPAGPTGTPIITSNITILAYGATLVRTGARNFRLFTIGNTGHLTIRRAYIRGFRAQGGNGGKGGGGGLGAGGAIFVMGGGLVIEASTFEGNGAYGGTGGSGTSGGGGGMGGNGGAQCYDSAGRGGTGGGGARGDGASCVGPDGGGGGGTVSNANGRVGGFSCGGNGADSDSGQRGQCPGGGGGGAGEHFSGILGYDGGSGAYGGGGGGGNDTGGGHGGRGGFGGGGGASGYAGFFGESGGDGGFGGGGGTGDDGLDGGDPGNGGFFAGNGGSSGGGGGAGLGGAIFNESGSVDVRNSTFAFNTTGGGYSAKAVDGVTGGGAIFSVNGHLTVLNATISGNLGRMGGGILVVQDSESKPTSFVLENSIIADNGTRECAITGFSIGSAFAGNLITSNADGSKFKGKAFIGCQGVVTDLNPQLGPLAYNQGATPTMAIGSTSPAFNAADPGSSIPVDQRRQERPAMGGFDIGAFELCIEGFGRLAQPCLILAGISTGEEDPVQLTVQINPSGGGVTTPGPGTQAVAEDTVVALKATPNAGYRFLEWSSNVTDQSDPSTTVFMNASQTVTARFAACACATDVSASIGITRGALTLNTTTGRYVQTVMLKNKSTAAITGPLSLVLDHLSPNATLYNAKGNTALMLPADSPYINRSVTLAPGQSISIKLQFTNPGNIAVAYNTRVLAGPGSR